MTEREMLEFAAKAAGYYVISYVEPGTAYYKVVGEKSGLELRAFRQIWNSLTDDGDAQRLAVKLGLLVYVMLDAGFTGIRLPGEHIGGKYDVVQTHDGDPYAATRRAITRAAAIGEKIP